MRSLLEQRNDYEKIACQMEDSLYQLTLAEGNVFSEADILFTKVAQELSKAKFQLSKALLRLRTKISRINRELNKGEQQ